MMDTYLAQLPDGKGGCTTIQQLHSSGGDSFKRIARMWAIKAGHFEFDTAPDLDSIEVFRVVEFTENGHAAVVESNGEFFEVAA